MIKFARKNMIILSLFSSICVSSNYVVSAQLSHDTEQEAEYKKIMKQDILCLMLAYPEYISNVEKEPNGSVFLTMKSGKKILYDDRTKKNQEQKLENPDLQDTLEQSYPLGGISKIMEKGLDPGRCRSYKLLNEVYGSSEQAIRSNLMPVNTRYIHLMFNSKNNAALKLKEGLNELVPLAESNRKVKACLLPINGTFNYRFIAGTSRLSPHAYGIAIDFARDNRDYWQWATTEQGQKRLEEYSMEMVQSLEKHNFIWGGKWSHFDILHYEYRPEIILKAKYFGNKHIGGSTWYEGAQINDENVKKFINRIDEIL